jgi:hypothetical protein
LEVWLFTSARAVVADIGSLRRSSQSTHDKAFVKASRLARPQTGFGAGPGDDAGCVGLASGAAEGAGSCVVMRGSLQQGPQPICTTLISHPLKYFILRARKGNFVVQMLYKRLADKHPL